MGMLKKNKKFIFDLFLSLIASGVPIAVLQLIVYPQLAKILGGDNYGLLLTVYSIWMLAANATGGALNNIKLLRNNCYMDENIEGDYPIILKDGLCGAQ